MNRLVSFRHFVVAAALLAAPACKNNDPAHEADRAAERVNDKVDDLNDRSKDLADTARDKAGDLGDKARDNAKATAEAVKDLANDTKHRVGDAVDKTAKQIQGVVADRRERMDDLGDKAAAGTKDIADDAKAVGKAAHDVHEAQQDFRYQKAIRVASLRGEHGVIASQAMLINAFASIAPVSETDHAKIAEKLQVFQMRIDETGNVIQGLDAVEAKDFQARDDEAAKAMSRLDQARQDAWDALDGAKRLGRTSMR
jgi:hypothetical protein